MNWPHLRRSLVSSPEHHERPQEIARIDHALRLVEEGLSGLASLGHLFHLASGPEPSPEAWPRVLFHLEAAPQGHLVFCAEDAEFLGEGWFDTLDEAKHASGLGHQYRRGGVFPKRNLPALPLSFSPSPLDSSERPRKDSSNGSR